MVGREKVASSGRSLGEESSVPRLANWAVIGVFIILAFAAIAQGRDFLMPVTMAALLFFVLTPLRRYAERRGVPDALTAAAITLSILLSIAVIAYAASRPLGQAMSRLPIISSQLDQKFDSFGKSLSGLREAARTIDTVQSSEVGGDQPPTITVEQDRETTLGMVMKTAPLLLVFCA